MKLFYATLILFLTASMPFGAFGQQSSLSASELEDLYAQRLNLSNQGLDYADVEMEILRSGIYPSVLAEKELTEDGTWYFFNIYSPVSGLNNQEAVENRFKQMFPEIQSIEIRENRVKVLFGEVSQENLHLFFYYLGYNAIQLKN